MKTRMYYLTVQDDQRRILAHRSHRVTGSDEGSSDIEGIAALIEQLQAIHRGMKAKEAA